jgi:hypothetical protein
MLPLLPPCNKRELGDKTGIRQLLPVDLFPFSYIELVSRRYSCLNDSLFGEISRRTRQSFIALSLADE